MPLLRVSFVQHLLHDLADVLDGVDSVGKRNLDRSIEYPQGG